MPGRPDPDRAAALKDWEAVFGSPPPSYLSVALMQKAIGHECQCKRAGGLPAATRRALLRISAGEDVAAAAPTKLNNGARLVREWNGRSYHVDVIEGGFRMDDRTWPSLSAIAKHITGTTWSGPRFFGLTSRGST
ncbi:Protein of unknown function (DUF2924) [Litoreibacter ponti]|uniref:DUF2924 family protein n=1 Tax=Litoreibacter ponti TaxID=1510457 RepID=A0A2T6BN14_9RHOB|nr:DUF2924 domain-containing protein [Litoreibacter ponti]PTX57424.1 Protein of unknown function (DUF2924) [Litoreibacter ponti]